MICGHCNKEIDDDSKFCPYCGHTIEIKVEEKNNEKIKSLEKSIFKKIIYRIIAVVIAYIGFLALKVVLLLQGIPSREATIVGAFMFIGVYNISTSLLLKIKSSEKKGIWFILISIFLVFISIKGEPERATSSVKDKLTSLKNKIPKKLDEYTTLSKLDINGDKTYYMKG